MEFLLDRHLQTHHSMSDAQLKYASDKERAISHLNLQNYHPSLIEGNKFTNEGNKSDGSLMSGIHSNLFALNSISNQYAKGIDLASLHDSLNRAQTTVEDSHNIRVKHLFSMTNNDNVAKLVAGSENPNASKNLNLIDNDRNNNKSSMAKDKIEQPAPLFKNFEPPSEKLGQSGHSNSKSGVSLKCAYCEAREDFKSR